MKSNVTFKFPLPEDLDRMRQFGSVEEIKGHLKELFSSQYPLMLYPYQVF